MPSHRLSLTLISTLVLAALLVCWQVLNASRTSANVATENLARCQALARQIKPLQAKPAQASLQAESEEEYGSLLQECGKAARVPETAFLGIHPETPRRVPKTSYLEQPARVEIRQISLSQLAALLLEVTAHDRRILPTSLRLTAPKGKQEGPTESWQGEFVLTHLIFSPESSPP